MKTHHYIISVILLALAISAAIIAFITLLWNDVGVSILGLKPVTYWQACKLWLMANLIFSGVTYRNKSKE